MNTREPDKAEGNDNARGHILSDPLYSDKPTEGDVGKQTKGAVTSILRTMDNRNKQSSREFHDPGPDGELCGEIYRVAVGLLNAVGGSRMRIALDSINCDNICSLMELIRKPGLIISLRSNGEKLSNEQCRELLALDSFINWVRNGCWDITTMTRKDFLYFMHETDYYGINDHIIFNEEERVGSHKYLMDEYGENYKPPSDRIVKLFEAIDITLGELETYPGFQCWDTIKLLPDNDPNEDAHEYVRRVLLPQGNKPLHHKNVLSTISFH